VVGVVVVVGVEMKLSAKQQPIYNAIFAAWAANSRVVMPVLPTGGGKTVVFSHVARDFDEGPVVLMAHRSELVGQMSNTLARLGIFHNIIGSKNTIRFCVNAQMREYGLSFYDANARYTVASVDTIMARRDALEPWAATVGLVVVDEGHHVLRDNKWGKAFLLFCNAKGLFVTATPGRGDGKGLGSHADGLVDELIVGPGMSEMIEDGYLCDYRLYAPDSGLDLRGVDVTSSGDYSKPQLVKRVHETPQIIGNVVDTYINNARGKLGITFAVDVEAALEIAAEYNRRGVPAEALHGKSKDHVRDLVLRRFREREIHQIVNVDLFGEGFDVPAVECVSFARPTASYNVYAQQFGRALRPLVDGGFYQLSKRERKRAIRDSGKARAMVFDHVGNVLRHGLPDAPRNWTLDRRERGAKRAVKVQVPIMICPQCSFVHEKLSMACPDCGFMRRPESRSKPEHVDGDLTELDDATLAKLRGGVERIDMDDDAYRRVLEAEHCPPVGVAANLKRHTTDQAAQAFLRDAMAWWAGAHREKGRSNSEIYKRFYWAFDTDVMSAKTLKAKEAIDLAKRIGRNIGTDA
jgi:superfamily II DNA or RNA helicase